MSFVHFDEMYDIIIGLMEEEVFVNNEMPLEPFAAPIAVPMEPLEMEHYWWEEAFAEENHPVKEKEELYV